MYYYYPRKRVSLSAKWQNFYNEPYLIVDKIGPVNYVIQKSPTADKLVHVDKLKLITGSTPRSWLEDRTTTPSDNTIETPISLPVSPQPQDNDEIPMSDVTQPENSLLALGRGHRLQRIPERLTDYSLY